MVSKSLATTKSQLFLFLSLLATSINSSYETPSNNLNPTKYVLGLISLIIDMIFGVGFNTITRLSSYDDIFVPVSFSTSVLFNIYSSNLSIVVT